MNQHRIVVQLRLADKIPLHSKWPVWIFARSSGHRCPLSMAHSPNSSGRIQRQSHTYHRCRGKTNCRICEMTPSSRDRWDRMLPGRRRHDAHRCRCIERADGILAVPICQLRYRWHNKNLSIKTTMWISKEKTLSSSASNHTYRTPRTSWHDEVHPTNWCKCHCDCDSAFVRPPEMHQYTVNRRSISPFVSAYYMIWLYLALGPLTIAQKSNNPSKTGQSSPTLKWDKYFV